MRRLLRLAYLLAQHPLHVHRWLVDRGLAQGWIRDFAEFWDSVRPPGLPITDYTSFMWLCYHFSARFRERHPTGDHFDDPDAQYARLLSYVLRRERHPLRMLRVAWVLRRCKAVLEFGAGAGPYAQLCATAWPAAPRVFTWDLPDTLLAGYQRWQWPLGALPEPPVGAWDGIVCTETLEHLPDPFKTAEWMTEASPLICFDFVDDGHPRRAATLAHFAQTAGRLTGPDRRGLYVWRR